jgi:hypothetical protein
MSNKGGDKLANYHLNSRMVLLAFFVLFGSIFLASGTDPTGGSWGYYGGVISNFDTSVVIDNEGNHHRFAIANDGSLWDNKAGGWYNLGGVVTSASWAVKDAAGWIHVFVRGSDGALWDRRFNPGDMSTGGWISLGGYMQADTRPTAVIDPSIDPSFPGQIAVYVQGGDHALWCRRLGVTNGGSEIDPILYSWFNYGGQFQGSPYACAFNNPPYSLDIFVAVWASDDALWIKGHPTFGNPTGWKSLGGGLNGEPSLIVNPTNPNYMDVFVKGNDNSLWGNQLDTIMSPLGWFWYGGQLAGTSSPSPIIDNVHLMHAFVRGTDNGLWDCILAYRTWYNLGGIITHRPAAIFHPSGFYVYARGTDSALWGYFKSIS